MTESLFDHLAGTVAVILFIWSVALVWASWRIRCMLMQLIEERRELRRWKRLSGLRERQNHKWQ